MMGHICGCLSYMYVYKQATKKECSEKHEQSQTKIVPYLAGSLPQLQHTCIYYFLLYFLSLTLSHLHTHTYTHAPSVIYPSFPPSSSCAIICSYSFVLTSMYSSTCVRWLKVGVIPVSITAPVIGEVISCPFRAQVANHSSRALRSYVWPSLATTGCKKRDWEMGQM